MPIPEGWTKAEDDKREEIVKAIEPKYGTHRAFAIATNVVNKMRKKKASQ